MGSRQRPSGYTFNRRCPASTRGCRCHHGRQPTHSRPRLQLTLSMGARSGAQRTGRRLGRASCYFDIQIDADTGACAVGNGDAKTRLGALCAAPKGTVLQTPGSTAKLTDANSSHPNARMTTTRFRTWTRSRRFSATPIPPRVLGWQSTRGLGKFIAVDEDKEEVVCGQPRAGRLGIFKLIRCQNGLFRIWTPAVNAPAGVYIDVLNGNSSGAVDAVFHHESQRRPAPWCGRWRRRSHGERPRQTLLMAPTCALWVSLRRSIEGFYN